MINERLGPCHNITVFGLIEYNVSMMALVSASLISHDVTNIQHILAPHTALRFNDLMMLEERKKILFSP